MHLPVVKNIESYKYRAGGDRTAYEQAFHLFLCSRIYQQEEKKQC